MIKQSLTFTPENGVERMALTVGRGAKGDSAVQHSELILRGDSAVSHVEQANGAPTAEHRIAVPAGAVPFINLSGLSLEQIIRRARAMGRDTLNVPVLLTNGQTIYASVARAGADSVVIVLGGVVLRARADGVGRLLGASVPAQNVTFLRLPGDSPAAAWSPMTVSYAAPAGAPYAAEEIAVRTPAGLTLTGTLTIPAHKSGARLPAVVMITGSGAQDRDEALPGISAEYRPFRDIADTLSRRGIAVLRLDDRGVGGSSAGPATATTADFADDVRAALAWLRARPEIDPARLGLVGHSEGGIIAPMVAVTDGRLRGIALIAGTASRGLDIVHEQLRYLITQDTSLSATRRDSLIARCVGGSRFHLQNARVEIVFRHLRSARDGAARAHADAHSPGGNRPSGAGGRGGRARSRDAWGREPKCDGAHIPAARSSHAGGRHRQSRELPIALEFPSAPRPARRARGLAGAHAVGGEIGKYG